MKAIQSRIVAMALLVAPLLAWGASAPTAASAPFAARHGGYLIANDFTVDTERHGVISPPAEARAGDLLRIHPLRLNPDEYLLLQKCTSVDCSKAEVVRAWNTRGYMGPYPVISNKIPVEAGAKYFLWMQRIPANGGDTFALYERDSPPFVFIPSGARTARHAAEIKAAQERGPTPVTKLAPEGSTSVATFEGGSVVRMQMLRADAVAGSPDSRASQ
jgi:hypothetical protein